VQQEEVKALWKDKGKSTASFGTGIHAVLEDTVNGVEPRYDMVVDSMKKTRKLYMKNLELGETIHKAKRKKGKDSVENYAKPTHLDIRALMKSEDDSIIEYTKKIIEDFKNKYKKAGYDLSKALAEVYVTFAEFNMGGEIDLLLIKDLDKKICRVQDHKIKDKDLEELSSKNELINELAKKKASELDVIIIQLSFYAFCLTKAGWTVEGGDVFGRNGKWKFYNVKLIPTKQMEELLIKYLNK